MKNFLKISAVLVVAALVVAALVQHHDMHGMQVMFNGQELDSPFDFLVGLFAAGTGMAIAVLVMLFVAALLAVVFAGVFASVGAVAVGGLGVAALVVALAVSPLLLFALIPIWLVRRLTRPSQPAPLPAQSYETKPAL